MVRLPDIVNQVRRRVNEATNMIRYPVQMAKQAARKTGQQIYENIQLPGGRQSPPFTVSSRSDATESHSESPVSSTTTPTLIRQRQAATGAEVSVAPRVNGDSGQAARRNLRAGLPLPSGIVLKSRWNSYTVGDCFQETERTRLYRGTDRSSEPVLIQEYRLFDRDFNLTEIEDRQKAFERLIELNLKISNGPDFRIVKLVDAIVLPKEHCCYLITKPVSHHTTLAAYLSDYEVLSSQDIRTVLHQILQTLQFLHEACRVHFPTGELERGLPHGNLNLNSLLIRQLHLNVPYGQQFFVYLTNLSLWEHLFYPPASRRFHEQVAKTSQDLGSAEQDLADLGLVGFQLAGGTVSSTRRQPIDLETDPAWQELNDLPLKQFIERLMGLRSPFRTAEEALLTLRSLPTSQDTPELAASVEAAASTPSQPGRLLPIALLLVLGILGLIGWLSWRKISISSRPPSLPFLSESLSTFQSIKSVPSVITYEFERDGAREFVQSRTLIPDIPDSVTGTDDRQTLIEKIENRYNRYREEKILIRQDSEGDRRDEGTPRERLFEQIAAGRVEVGFARLPNDILPNDIPQGLTYSAVAHDALTVLVPFVDPYTAKNTVGELKGAISLDELRQLYTQPYDVTEFRGKPVKLFFPESEETNRIFQALVLRNDPELVRRFNALQEKAKARDRQWLATRTGLNNKLYEKMLVDFFETTDEDKDAIGIGFDRLSRAFEQCSVYPLAIQQGMRTYAAVVHADGQPINEDTDLCGAKGSYFPAIERYHPDLRYDLGLVYKEDSKAGKKLAELLETSEGQYLIREVGLIPMEPVSELMNAVWDQTDEGSK